MTTALLLNLSPARADAGGGDAANDWRTALTVAPGAYTGRVGEAGDEADWYRVAHGPGQGVRATISMPNVGEYVLYLRSDDGGFGTSAWLTPSGWQANVTRSAVHGGNGAVRVGIVNWWNPVPVNYTITFEVVDLPDVAVTDLRVENRPLRTDAGEAYTGTLRRVTIDVANTGAAGSVYLTVYAITPTDGAYTFIGSGSFTLGRGDSTTRTYDWDAAGIVGDVDIIAHASAGADADGSDNQRTLRHYVLVGGTGKGITAEASPCAFSVVATCVLADPAEGSAYAFVATLLAAGGVSAAFDGHWIVAGTSLSASLAWASVIAHYDVLHGGGVAYACGSALLTSTCVSHSLP